MKTLRVQSSQGLMMPYRQFDLCEKIMIAVMLVTSSFAINEVAVAEAPETFDVLFSEYRIDGEIDLLMKPDWIIASVLESKTKDDGKIKSVRSIRMKCAEDCEAQSRFQKQVQIGNEHAANVEFRSIGSVASVVCKSADENLITQISYSSSWLSERKSKEKKTNDEESNEDVRFPAEGNFEVQTTLSLTPGKPELIGGLSGEESTIVVITIE